MTKENFNVTGMSCSACSARVEKTVGKIVGADNVSVNLLTNSMQVKFDAAIHSSGGRCRLRRVDKTGAHFERLHTEV